MVQAVVSNVFQRRRAGVLLHPTSLPAATGELGNLGEGAYRFIDFLVDAGLSVWQMLPIGPTHTDLSPYQSLSAHAGNANLISVSWLYEQQWLTVTEAGDQLPLVPAIKMVANNLFEAHNEQLTTELLPAFQEFCASNNAWLEDFALFQMLRKLHQAKPWYQWPENVKQRDAETLATLTKEYRQEIHYYRVEQFIFRQQWQALHDYAKARHIYLFGDIPIFVAHDSADVWADQQLFRIDEQGNPITVAGVPPDYFSATGQHWGNPHYDWDAMQADGFQWWLARLGSQLHFFDLLRIDHFRGLEAFWEIPGSDKDARNGRWVKAPGHALLQACFATFPNLPLIAENLGVITEEVEALRKEFNLPGMLVLQFGFDGNAKNPHLPHHHTALDVIYTGTHDNDTTLGWYETLDENSRAYLNQYFCGASDAMPWLLIKAALASVAQMTVVPMQDWLALDSQHRMNTPGTAENNWHWQFEWEQIPNNLSDTIKQLLQLYDRS